MIPEWNYRESRDSPIEWDFRAPVGGLTFISGSQYEVLFRHEGTGRVVAPDYDVFASGLSCRRVPLDPCLVKRVDRYLSMERIKKQF
jgi:hypothetical protein